MPTRTSVNWKSLWIFYRSVGRLIDWNSNLKSVKKRWQGFKNLLVLATGVKKFAHPKSVKKAWERFKNSPISNLRKKFERCSKIPNLLKKHEGLKNSSIPNLRKKHDRGSKICQFWQVGLKYLTILNLWKKDDRVKKFVSFGT